MLRHSERWDLRLVEGHTGLRKASWVLWGRRGAPHLHQRMSGADFCQFPPVPVSVGAPARAKCEAGQDPAVFALLAFSQAWRLPFHVRSMFLCCCQFSWCLPTGAAHQLYED